MIQLKNGSFPSSILSLFVTLFAMVVKRHIPLPKLLSKILTCLKKENVFLAPKLTKLQPFTVYLTMFFVEVFLAYFSHCGSFVTTVSTLWKFFSILSILWKVCKLISTLWKFFYHTLHIVEVFLLHIPHRGSFVGRLSTVRKFFQQTFRNVEGGGAKTPSPLK